MMSSFLTWVNESIIVILTAIECYERRLFGGRDNELSCDMMNLMFYLGCFWLQIKEDATKSIFSNDDIYSQEEQEVEE